MSRLVLIRHGQSVWNAERRLQGQADPPLSPLGETQARTLAPQLRDLGIERSVSSDLRRAAQTADLIGLDTTPDARWREIDVGQWAGRHIDELRAEVGERWRGWRAGDYTPPGGERWPDFLARIAEAMAALPDEDVAVVTHGGVVRAVVALLLDLPPDRLAPVPPASVSVLERGAWPRLRGYGLGAEVGRQSPD
jgi:glucosyl-3-phosphoglycerate phosphatase